MLPTSSRFWSHASASFAAAAAAAVSGAGCKLLVSLDGYGDGEPVVALDASADAPGDAEVEAGADSSDGGGCAEGTKRACYDGPAGTSNTGKCRDGESWCIGGSWGPCKGEVRPEPEACDTFDNDCNGFADDGLTLPCYDGPQGTANQAPCHAGQKTCAGGTWGVCEEQVTPVDEVCNGTDDDCNGQVDDFPGPQNCYEGPAGTEGTGLCRSGQWFCAGGAWSACEGQVLPAPEVCDGEDNDCNGVADDEPEDIHTGVPCGQQCLTTVNDADCDGLVGAGAQDPWPATCNPLLFADRFSAAPSLPTWLLTGGVDHACGGITLAPGARLTLAAPPAALTTPMYLVEARVRLGVVEAGKPAFTVGIAQAVQGSDQKRSCQIYTQFADWNYAFLHLDIAAAGVTDSFHDGVYHVDASEGATYILQAYGIGTEHHCRLLSASGGGALVASSLTSSPVSFTAAGTVAAYTTGREATFDYVRVFQIP